MNLVGETGLSGVAGPGLSPGPEAAAGGRPPCPACRGGSERRFSVGDLNGRYSDRSFTYYRCRDCGLIFLWPIPADLDRYYLSEYLALSHGYALPLDELARSVGPERYKIELVKRFSSGGRLLELGPGRGGFAFLAKEAGFDVSAIEMSGESCRYLTEVIGVRAIHESDTAAAILAEGTYSVIAAWHVIEHLPDLWSTISAAAARLEPGGILILAAPNPASFQFRILGRNRTHVDAPRHLQLVPLPVLERRANALGLHTLLRTTNDEGGVGWNRYGSERSLTYALPRRPTRLYVWATRVLPGVLASVCRPMEETGLRGCAYTVIFRKDQRA